MRRAASTMPRVAAGVVRHMGVAGRTVGHVALRIGVRGHARCPQAWPSTCTLAWSAGIATAVATPEGGTMAGQYQREYEESYRGGRRGRGDRGDSGRWSGDDARMQPHDVDQDERYSVDSRYGRMGGRDTRQEFLSRGRGGETPGRSNGNAPPHRRRQRRILRDHRVIEHVSLPELQPRQNSLPHGKFHSARPAQPSVRQPPDPPGWVGVEISRPIDQIGHPILIKGSLHRVSAAEVAQHPALIGQ